MCYLQTPAISPLTFYRLNSNDATWHTCIYIWPIQWHLNHHFKRNYDRNLITLSNNVGGTFPSRCFIVIKKKNSLSICQYKLSVNKILHIDANKKFFLNDPAWMKSNSSLMFFNRYDLNRIRSKVYPSFAECLGSSCAKICYISLNPLWEIKNSTTNTFGQWTHLTSCVSSITLYIGMFNFNATVLIGVKVFHYVVTQELLHVHAETDKF